MALRDLAGDRVEITLVAPDPDFTYKPLAVEEPFSHQPQEQRALDPIAREFGVRLRQAAVERVDPADHRVELSTGRRLGIRRCCSCASADGPRPAFVGAIGVSGLRRAAQHRRRAAGRRRRAIGANRLRRPTRSDMAPSDLRSGADGPPARREPGSRELELRSGDAGVGSADHVRPAASNAVAEILEGAAASRSRPAPTLTRPETASSS